MTYIDSIRTNDRLLVVGGGSGTLLRYLDVLGLNSTVDFVDVSAAMIGLAKKQQLNNISVNFININILDHIASARYDVIITNFFFDQYNEYDSLIYLRHLKSLCHSGTTWFYADFVQSKSVRDRFILWLMYNFFSLFANLHKVRLLDHNRLFLDNGLRLVKTRQITSLINSGVYRIAVPVNHSRN